jgi:hypothetical protein
MILKIIIGLILAVPFVIYWYLKSNKEETNPEIKKELDAFFEEDDDSLDYN